MLEKFSGGDPAARRKLNAIVDLLNAGIVETNGAVIATVHPSGRVALLPARPPATNAGPSLAGITNIQLVTLDVCVAGVVQTINVLTGDAA